MGARRPRTARSLCEDERVDDAEFDRLLQRLLADPHRAIELLNESGDTFWRDTLVTQGRQIEAGSRYGLERLLGNFGGMGSFKDLVLTSGTGHDLVDLGATADLDDLRSRIYSGAKALLRDLDHDRTDADLSGGRPGDDLS